MCLTIFCRLGRYLVLGVAAHQRFSRVPDAFGDVGNLSLTTSGCMLGMSNYKTYSVLTLKSISLRLELVSNRAVTDRPTPTQIMSYGSSGSTHFHRRCLLKRQEVSLRVTLNYSRHFF